MASRKGRSAHDFGADPIIVAYGAGVDSTAMLIGLRDRRVPIELILFADTGSEKPETAAYLRIIQAWLATNAMHPVTVIKRDSPRAGDTSLHEECLRKRVLPSLAYGGHSCSLKWKVDPQWKYTRHYFGWDSRSQSWPHGKFVTKLIGYDAGPVDARRIRNATGKWRDEGTLRGCDPWGRAAAADEVGLLDVPGLEKTRGGVAGGGTPGPR
jgi:hypothetical protein